MILEFTLEEIKCLKKAVLSRIDEIEEELLFLEYGQPAFHEAFTNIDLLESIELKLTQTEKK